MEFLAGIGAALFVLGGFWFWVSFIGLFFLVMAFSENDRYLLATISLGLFVWGVIAFNVITLSLTSIAIILIVYALCGVVWSFIKWFSYLRKRAEMYAAYKVRWSKTVGIAGITESTNMRETLNDEEYYIFREYLSQSYFIDYTNSRIIPTWKDKVDKLTGWMLFWPTSLFWTFLNDPLVRFFRWTVKRFGNWYDGIANKIFAGVGVSANEDEEWKDSGRKNSNRMRDQ